MDGHALICFLGPPGSGKGTQSKIAAEEFGLIHIGTGDLVRELRATAKRGDPLGIRVKERYDQGIPQPDDIILEIMERHLASLDLSQGVVMDAFPLSLGQAEGMEKLIETFGFSRPLVAYFDVSERETVRRITERRRCKGCGVSYRPGISAYEEGICSQCGGELVHRPDDTEKVVRRRYEEYDTRLKPVLTYYEERGELVRLDGERSIDDVSQDVIELLKRKLP